jgi:hypothetical protein
MKGFPSPAELGFSKDDELGFDLFKGIIKDHFSWPPKNTFLSRTTDPTEDDARRALCRTLRNGKAHPMLLMALADAFDPDGKSELKVVLKKRSKGHSDWRRDLTIAFKVHTLRFDNGKSRLEAIAEVADTINKNEKHVEKIYDKMRAYVIRFYKPRSPASDRPSDAVT